MRDGALYIAEAGFFGIMDGGPLRQQPGIEVLALLTTFNAAADRVAMHAALVEAQAAAAGRLPLLDGLVNNALSCSRE